MWLEPIIVVRLLWTGIAFVGMIYAMISGRAARRDVAVRIASKQNGPRLALARTRFVTAAAIAAMLVFFFFGGLTALVLGTSPPTAASYIISVLLICGELVLVAAVVYNQRQARTVLEHGIATERERVRIAEIAAETLASQERLTVATEANTAATEAQTAAIENGPMVALLDAAHENTDARDPNERTRRTDEVGE